jgi:aspartokinase
MAMNNIKGLKISGELCLVRLHTESRDSGLLPAFCSLLAGSQINMPFLSTESQAGGIHTTCCVDAAHQLLLKRLLSAEPVLQERAEYTDGVGLLTLFPHQSSLILFGRSLRALAEADLRVFAMASSIGALTYVLDYARLDKAAAVMQACFELAGNHAPFKAEFTVAQGTQRRPERKE